MKIIKKAICKIAETINDLNNHVYGDGARAGNEYTILNRVFKLKFTEILMSLIAYGGFIAFTILAFQILVPVYELVVLIAGDFTVETVRMALPALLYVGFLLLVTSIAALACYDVNVSISGETGVKVSKMLIVIIAIIVLGDSEIMNSPLVKKILENFDIQI